MYIYIYTCTYITNCCRFMGKAVYEPMKTKHQAWGSTCSEDHQCPRTDRPFDTFHFAEPHRRLASQADSLGRSHLCTQPFGRPKNGASVARTFKKPEHLCHVKSFTIGFAMFYHSF